MKMVPFDSMGCFVVGVIGVDFVVFAGLGWSGLADLSNGSMADFLLNDLLGNFSHYYSSSALHNRAVIDNEIYQCLLIP